MIILSFFDSSGAWSKPYSDAGYDVHRIDLTLGSDIRDFEPEAFRSTYGPVHGILAAPPCTDFAGSGARWWAEKDKDGRTAESLALIDCLIEAIHTLTPSWYAIENPVGRLSKLRPMLGQPFYFQPHYYGDAYTKKTGLWGEFCHDLPRNDVEPVMYTTKNGKRGSWQWAKLGGKSDRTKALRSITPAGFAQAFFEVNP